jgi:hypothetical protein
MPLLLIGSAGGFVGLWFEITGIGVVDVAGYEFYDKLWYFFPIAFISAVLFVSTCFWFNFSTWKMVAVLSVIIAAVYLGNVNGQELEPFEQIVSGEVHPVLFGSLYVLIIWFFALFVFEAAKTMIGGKSNKAR